MSVNDKFVHLMKYEEVKLTNYSWNAFKERRSVFST